MKSIKNGNTKSTSNIFFQNPLNFAKKDSELRQGLKEIFSLSGKSIGKIIGNIVGASLGSPIAIAVSPLLIIPVVGPLLIAPFMSTIVVGLANIGGKIGNGIGGFLSKLSFNTFIGSGKENKYMLDQATNAAQDLKNMLDTTENKLQSKIQPTEQSLVSNRLSHLTSLLKKIDDSPTTSWLNIVPKETPAANQPAAQQPAANQPQSPVEAESLEQKKSTSKMKM